LGKMAFMGPFQLTWFYDLRYSCCSQGPSEGRSPFFTLTLPNRPQCARTNSLTQHVAEIRLLWFKNSPIFRITPLPKLVLQISSKMKFSVLVLSNNLKKKKKKKKE